MRHRKSRQAVVIFYWLIFTDFSWCLIFFNHKYIVYFRIRFFNLKTTFITVVITVYYRERKITRNMLTTNPMQAQVQCCQMWSRRRKREENHMFGALMFMLSVNISCWIISNGIYPYSNQYIFFYWYPFLVRPFGLRR